MFSRVGINKNLQEQLAEEVKKIKADYAEIRAEESLTTIISFRGKEPEIITEPFGLGFFVRVLVNGSWGIATFTDITKLKEKIPQAVTAAKMQGKGTVQLAQIPQTEDEILPTFKKDFRQVPLKEKVTLVKHYNNLLLTGATGIQTSSIGYTDNFLTKYFVNCQGARILQTRPYIRLVFQAVGRVDDVIEISRGSNGHIGGFEIVEGLDNQMLTVSKEAVELAKAPKVKSGIYTVILDPRMAGTFAHEAFGHLSEADYQYENPKVLEQMKLGKKIGSDKLNIIDDPNLPSGWGNFTYDDEGVLAKKVQLVTRGVITSRLHSLETAAKLKEEPNGRARADGFSNKPIVRMSNTYFQPGSEKLNDLIASTPNGLLAINWLGGMTAMENFTFTAMYGVMIESGKLAQKVRGVKLMGNVFETLKHIDGVTSDFAHDQGTCGKQGQHMPVGSGGGYVRINNVTVGGE